MLEYQTLMGISAWKRLLWEVYGEIFALKYHMHVIFNFI